MKNLVDFENYYDLDNLEKQKWKIKYEKCYLKVIKFIDKYLLI